VSTRRRIFSIFCCCCCSCWLLFLCLARTHHPTLHTHIHNGQPERDGRAYKKNPEKNKKKVKKSETFFILSSRFSSVVVLLLSNSLLSSSHYFSLLICSPIKTKSSHAAKYITLSFGRRMNERKEEDEKWIGNGAIFFTWLENGSRAQKRREMSKNIRRQVFIFVIFYFHFFESSVFFFWSGPDVSSRTIWIQNYIYNKKAGARKHLADVIDVHTSTFQPLREFISFFFLFSLFFIILSFSLLNVFHHRA
jgi:hypothetical protein